MSVSTTRVAIDGRSLLSQRMFDRLAAQVAADHPELTSEMPARIVDQALAFLGACAVTTERLGPSDIVDIGWHTFILYTREYAAFCQRVAGRFIHHQPDGEPGEGWPVLPESESVTIFTAVEAMRCAGYRVDISLWSSDGSSDCTQCHAGCTDSPQR